MGGARKVICSSRGLSRLRRVPFRELCSHPPFSLALPTFAMRLNFTGKDVGDREFVDEATGQVHYTIRSNIDGKMKTVRRPAQDLSPNARGPFVSRFHLHFILSNKVELREGEQLKGKEWMQEEGNG